MNTSVTHTNLLLFVIKKLSKIQYKIKKTFKYYSTSNYFYVFYLLSISMTQLVQNTLKGAYTLVG